MITVNNLTVFLKQQRILDNVSCSLLPGRITSFIGKSGAGKTTLLKAIANLAPLTNGTVTINSKQLATLTADKRAQTIGYVFQDFNLFQNLTVLENCIDPLLIRGVARDIACEEALSMLQKLDMNTHAQKYPSELSGGQQQRVAIARALCLKPQVLLLDEPTASLDPSNTDTLVSILQALAKTGLTIALSSQDMSLVRKVFDRTYYLESGKIIETCDTAQATNDCPLIRQWLS